MINGIKDLKVSVSKNGRSLSEKSIKPSRYIGSKRLGIDMDEPEVNYMIFRNNLLIFLSSYMNEGDVTRNMAISNMVQMIDNSVIDILIRGDDGDTRYFSINKEVSKWLYINIRMCGYSISLDELMDFISQQNYYVNSN